MMRRYDRQWPDGLIVTHLDMQLARLYQNMGNQTFDDATFALKDWICHLSYERFRDPVYGL